MQLWYNAETRPCSALSSHRSQRSQKLDSIPTRREATKSFAHLRATVSTEKRDKEKNEKALHVSVADDKISEEERGGDVPL